MKKNILVSIILFIVLFNLNIVISKANTFNLLIDSGKDRIKENEELVLKVKTDKKIEATTFYIKYDLSKVSFVESLTQKAQVKDFHEDGIVRVVCVDMTKEKINEIDLKFKAKEDTVGKARFEISNLTMQFADDSSIYTEESFEKENLKNAIEIYEPFIKKPGMREAFIALICAFILLLIINIIPKVKNKNKKK